MTKSTIISTKLENLLELPNDNGASDFGEAVASTVANNEYISWAKFILTDDTPNENKQRITQEEFANLINSGTYMPFKMAYEKPKDGHEDAFPLGTIAHLKQSGNQIIALAALWKKEREEDIAYIKECIASKVPVNVSWEIMHEDSNTGEDGIENLIGTSLRGVTIVGRPAYAGRTPVLNVASTTTSNSEENKLNELELLQQRVTQLEADLAAKVAEIERLVGEASVKDTELSSLKEFKSAIEQKELEAQKFASIKELFVKSGINKPETFFEENKSKLLTMDQASLEFMVQELVAFSSTQTTTTSTSSTQVPVVPAVPTKPTIKELAEQLRKSSK